MHGKQPVRYFEAGGQYTSFMSTGCSVNNKSFGATSKRFDTKFEMKELFNREPGPGTYSVSTADSSILGSQSVSHST